MARRRTARITIRVAARRVGLLPRTMRRYVRHGLVGEPLCLGTRFLGRDYTANWGCEHQFRKDARF
jgi:hypothetical protein